MSSLGQFVQQADWKSEKHVPVIECADSVKAGEAFEVKVSVGKEIAHPNTTEHHIDWINLFFKPANDKFIYMVGRYEFAAHGQSAAGANQGPVYTEPAASASLKVDQPGTLIAVAYCNIHGLWESSKELTIA